MQYIPSDLVSFYDAKVKSWQAALHSACGRLMGVSYFFILSPYLQMTIEFRFAISRSKTRNAVHHPCLCCHPRRQGQQDPGSPPGVPAEVRPGELNEKELLISLYNFEMLLICLIFYHLFPGCRHRRLIPGPDLRCPRW